LQRKERIEEKRLRINGLGFFSVNGLGLDLSDFRAKKISFGFRKNQQGKAVKRLVKYEKLEKLSKWTGLFG